MTPFRTLVFALLLILGSSGQALAQQPDPRMLGMVITNPELGSYDRSLETALSAGVTRVPLTFFWSSLEPAPGQYDDSVLAVAALYYPALGLTVDLAVSPIATNRLVVPEDLQARALDDPEVIQRYLALLDHVLEILEDAHVETLLLGVEVDAWLGEDAAAWRSYTALTAAAASHVHRTHPGIELGVQSTTYSRLATPTNWETIDEVSDFVATSYFPMDGMNVRDPSVVADDFAALTQLYPNRVIRVVEAGFPSSRANGSSPELQAAFVHALFAIWDEYATQIVSITLSIEHDYSPSAVSQIQRFYGDPRPEYAAYMGSIGLRSWHRYGEPKPAWIALIQETSAREWVV
ncbi:MAG: hypothetical protein M9947_11535 [Thermomicrobiales bacterium]|nr:hypothetical protein [Thermomicrobiales bacterium]